MLYQCLRNYVQFKFLPESLPFIFGWAKLVFAIEITISYVFDWENLVSAIQFELGLDSYGWGAA